MKKNVFVLVAMLACLANVSVRGQEMYAVFTGEEPSNGVLTFYYDNKQDAREGIVYPISSNNLEEEPLWKGKKYTTAVFDASFADARPISTYLWFAHCYVEKIENLQYLNTSQVKSMNSMFKSSLAIKDLDLHTFDTKNVIDMDEMFYNCKSLEHVDLSSFETPNLVSMWSTFGECVSLKSIDLTNFDMRQVTTFRELFAGCRNLKSVNMNGVHTDRVVDTKMMFRDCESLEELDLGYIGESYSSKMSYMFSGCKSLTTVDLSNFNLYWPYLDISGMFSNCENLTTIYCGVGSDYSMYPSNDYYRPETIMCTEMFKGCIRLRGGEGTTYSEEHYSDKKYLCEDVGPQHPGYMTRKNPDEPSFYLLRSDKGNTITFFYDNKWKQHADKAIRMRKEYVENSDSFPSWHNNNPLPLLNAEIRSARKVVFDESFSSLRPTSLAYWFYSDLYGRQGILLTGQLCELEGLENLNTSQLKSMRSTFNNCGNLKKIDLSCLDTRQVEDMSGMFGLCSSLEDVNLRGLSTENVQSFSYMFQDCISLKTLDLSDFVFAHKDVDLTAMFNGCNNLATIYGNDNWGWDWDSDVSKSENMFAGCYSLVGGAGTVCGSVSLDGKAVYDGRLAHVDGGTENPGLLTAIDPDGIKNVVSPLDDAPIYNVSGQRLHDVPAKGIYIQNGRKVVVK